MVLPCHGNPSKKKAAFSKNPYGLDEKNPARPMAGLSERWHNFCGFNPSEKYWSVAIVIVVIIIIIIIIIITNSDKKWTWQLSRQRFLVSELLPCLLVFFRHPTSMSRASGKVQRSELCPAPVQWSTSPFHFKMYTEGKCRYFIYIV